MTGEGLPLAKRTLYLFPDTNVFIQCRSLKEVDWSEWRHYAKIHLIVCQPIQREMDKHKNRGNDRVGKRARKTCSMFRQIILSEQDYELIRQDGPRIILSLDASPSPIRSQLPSSLDHSNHDDQLVGCIHVYRQQHEDQDVRLLTHDIGPMMTARSIRLPFVAVPDNWLLPPEPNKTEKDLARLSRELDRLKESEPRFRTRNWDDEGNEIDAISIEYIVYEPLSKDEIAALIDSLTTEFPIATGFGHREPLERASLWGWKDVYTPADDEAIAKYTTQEYPSWLEGCRSVFSDLHNELQRQVKPAFHFGATNDGIRPGKNVLLIISAKGSFKICPPQMEEDYSDESGEVDVQLKKPPKPPRGEWKSTSSLSWLATLGAGMGAGNIWEDSIPTIPDISLASADRSRDPDAFYYKPERPSGPVQSFMLECEQWRHGKDEEIFEGGVYVDGDKEEISGALECEIHAENLSTPTRSITPVRIMVTKASTGDYAFALAKKLSVAAREYK